MRLPLVCASGCVVREVPWLQSGGGVNGWFLCPNGDMHSYRCWQPFGDVVDPPPMERPMMLEECGHPAVSRESFGVQLDLLTEVPKAVVSRLVRGAKVFSWLSSRWSHLSSLCWGYTNLGGLLF
ncbi:hypothetical protein Nepgr_009305 [Nepenthes gracilis]|uniref:Uncharacterized protein n=1 Tax=Nepenthes gracilis TaxID=150966 RepID=A0AAD3SAM2_NEPGR|nr:hypothetical protein Nepgr_009305 [Nepenthes gracilis]